MSNQFVQYLNRAASGNFPLVIIMKLMLLEIPNLASLLLPLGFYVALLIAYGRLYAESEMTVLQACGYGPFQLLKHSYIMAFFVALLVGIIIIWFSPIIATERAMLLRTSGIKTKIQLISPGQFQSLSKGKQVFYVESMTPDHSKAKHIFLARQVEKSKIPQWDILFAKQAFAEVDEKTQEQYLILKKGQEYEGLPGQANYQVAGFDQIKVRLPHSEVNGLKDDIRTAKTIDLLPWNNTDIKKAAELQWRLSIPILVIVLTLIAVPLSRVNSRTGKFAKLLPAIIIFIIYANFLFVARNWMISGKTPEIIGMWWIHLVMASLGLILIWYNKLKLS
jgi:lipopolysaccharide export system permease protein